MLQFFENVYNFVYTMLGGIIWFIRSVPSMIGNVQTLVSNMPEFFAPFYLIILSAGIVIAVIKLL